MSHILVDGHSLTLEQFIDITRNHKTVKLSQDAVERVANLLGNSLKRHKWGRDKDTTKKSYY